MKPSARIVVFAKAPEPGTVKTRLVPPLDPQAAAALHTRLMKHALSTARAAALGPVDLACTPDIDHPFFRYCSARYGTTLVPQAAGDLGARMLYASRAALAAGTPVIFIGCDCPALTPAHLRMAARMLASGTDAVLGPAEDGGYVLLGLSRTDEELFRDTEWGSSNVLATARSRLSSLGWSWKELEVLWDVDRPADYERLLAGSLLDALPQP